MAFEETKSSLNKIFQNVREIQNEVNIAQTYAYFDDVDISIDLIALGNIAGSLNGPIQAIVSKVQELEQEKQTKENEANADLRT